ncbi:acetoacetate--CoA ligase [Cumulibacter manganitolerans]|uniref:acetoacetate--CoA ligase n=1 Tax=Cumulibacter manganitolerans TaxID=1884992 RepID=UPI001295AB1C|nr:acetoacetate--CoA ligase [Cumulibacter manganitolerans]
MNQAHQRGEVLWTPDERDVADSELGRYLGWLARTRGIELTTYDELWQWSVRDLEGFWQSVWDYFDIAAGTPPTAVLGAREMPGAQWFPGSTLNYAEHALRHQGERTAVVAVSQTRDRRELTGTELTALVGRAREGFRRLGLQKGDRVAAYLPSIPETVAAFLAAASLGVVWAAVAPEFGTDSVIDRLSQIEPKVLLTVDGYRYSAKDVDRRSESATIRAALPTVETMVAIDYLGLGADFADMSWDQLVDNDAPFEVDRVEFDHPLWILFSSGTTGLPKPIVHSHGGIVLEQLKTLGLAAGLGPQDRNFIYATTAWVMWNMLVSSLLTGASIVLYDGNPMYPDALRLWEVAAETEATAYTCGAPLLTAARKSGVDVAERYDLSRLRSISSTGAPLPAEDFRWVYETFGSDIYLQSGSGGTDVASGFVGGSKMLPVRAGEITARCLGVDAKALDPQGNPVVGEPGELVISQPMPSMPVFFWNDPGGERYRDSYFDMYPGQWRHGDWITFYEDGSSEITGRSDGTLNRGGVRLGTSEFYNVLDEFPEVEDALAVHLEGREGLGTLVLFVVLRGEQQLDDALKQRITKELQRRLSPRHGPDDIRQVGQIPYSLTGKKLEIPAKRLLQGRPRQGLVKEGSVRNPDALDTFEELAGEFADR